MIEIKILGPVSLSAGGRAVNLGDRRQRILLGILALERGLVGRDHLVRLLWEEKADQRDQIGKLYTCVAGLKRAVRACPDAGDVQIENVSQTGYRLVVPVGVIDYHQFRDLVAKARAALPADPRVAAEYATAALRRWGIEPMTRLRGGGFPFGVVDARLEPLVARMRDHYQAALMTYLNAEIACGRHAQLTAPLALLADDDPDAAGCQELTRIRARALDLDGQRPAALDVLHNLEETLNQIGCTFEQATVEMIRQMSGRPTGPLPPVPVPSACTLQITDPHGTPSPPYHLHGRPDSISIGRAVAHLPPPDIVVTSDSPSPVSRQHARLDRRKGAWWIVPEGKNQTRIRYRGRTKTEPLLGDARLRNGDVVIIRVQPADEAGRQGWEMKFIDPNETRTN